MQMISVSIHEDAEEEQNHFLRVLSSQFDLNIQDKADVHRRRSAQSLHPQQITSWMQISKSSAAQKTIAVTNSPFWKLITA